MTAVMTRMNLHTCVVKEIAPPAGRDARDNQTTAAFPNGYSAMEKTIAVTTATSCQKTVQFVNLTLTSNARTTDAYPNNGLVTLLMTAVTVPMNRKHNAKANTENVPSLSSIAKTENAYQADGDVVSFCRAFKISYSVFNDFSHKFFRSRRRLW